METATRAITEMIIEIALEASNPKLSHCRVKEDYG